MAFIESGRRITARGRGLRNGTVCRILGLGPNSGSYLGKNCMGGGGGKIGDVGPPVTGINKNKMGVVTRGVRGEVVGGVRGVGGGGGGGLGGGGGGGKEGGGGGRGGAQPRKLGANSKKGYGKKRVTATIQSTGRDGGIGKGGHDGTKQLQLYSS